MSNGIFLIDVDGVLLDKDKVWKAIEDLFVLQYPNRPRGEIRAFYNQHKGEKPNVDNVIEAGFPVYGPDFWKPFYDINFRSLRTPGWEELKTTSITHGLSLRVFSEGSRGRRPWMPGYVMDGYQPYKVEQLELGVPTLVFENKLAELPSCVERWKREGVSRIVGLDDWNCVVEEMQELGIEAYQFDGKAEVWGRGGHCESAPFSSGEGLYRPTHRIETLDQMAKVIAAA